VSCERRSLTSSGFGEDLVGGFGSDERLAAFAPGVDVGLDGGDEHRHAGEGAAAACLAGDDAEEDLDHAQLGPAGRGEVHRDPRVLRQPGMDAGVFVGRVVVPGFICKDSGRVVACAVLSS